jgi:hypothetical protein
MQGKPDIIPLRLPGKATSSHLVAIGGICGLQGWTALTGFVPGLRLED